MSFTDALNNQSNVCPDIMEKVKDVLSTNNVEYLSNGEYELVIPNTKKSVVYEILEEGVSVDNEVLHILIDITEVSNDTYIRQVYC